MENEEKLKCPKCNSQNITALYGLEKQHNGGNKWCMACGKIFDMLDNKEKILIGLENEKQTN